MDKLELIFVFSEKSVLSLQHKTTQIMFEFDQYLGFLAFLTILTIGFWLMIFLVSFIPYWIGGALYENWKLKREAKRQEEETL
ncbi:MAG TPA: hypothetical protein EYN07_12820 [Flavobacteriaceae bacterium]|nr:hypothetical protein [Flavobacteriaceae bacterium]HIB48635.1 hypothetical protein [Flavobacteriaceae bacterium]HIO00111.1 hypothetical protein [Flavobacteriaceae bacterium]